MTKLEQKREKLQGDLEKAIRLSVEGFMWSDVPLGIFMAIFAASICLWIPIIGWIAIPFVLIICPFMGTQARQKQYDKQVDKITKQISRVDLALDKL